MSDAESKRDDAPAKKKEKEKEKVAEVAPFAEGNHETTMTYGPGGFPRYIIALWVVFLIGYAAYFYTYGLPDLKAWGSP